MRLLDSNPFPHGSLFKETAYRKILDGLSIFNRQTILSLHGLQRINTLVIPTELYY